VPSRQGNQVIAASVPVTHIAVPSIDWFAIAPDVAIFAAALGIVLLRSLVRHHPRVHEASLAIAIAGVATSAVFTAVQWTFVQNHGAYQTLLTSEKPQVGMIAVDGFSVFAETVVLIATLLALLLSSSYLKRERLEGPEYFALMLCSATGMMLMTSANDLVTIFLSLEILSIALYVLAAFDRRRTTSQEAGLKYFLLGSFSSAVFLYGVALVYGGTGTTNLTGIADFLATTTLLHDGVLLLGIAFLVVGLGFKVAAAPFHMWTPDVYQGSPTPVTAFMASATKAAAFAAILRVFVGTFWLYSVDWRPIFFALAVVSLFVGSVAAIVQTDVKRMLAYSSISHAGYILIAVQAATAKGTSAALFYVLTYAFMTIGAFAVVAVVATQDDDQHALTDYRGLARRQPLLAGVFTLFLLAQAGVPLTGGFVAKLSVFSAAVDQHQYVLALLGMLAAAVAAYVYLRIVLAMYAPADNEPQPALTTRARVDVGSRIALAIAAAAVLFLGIMPGGMLDFAKHATQLLTH
jgi:NADH-quinone oxidoreductase subunit N